MFGKERVIFVSGYYDGARGWDDGMYELGGQPVIVKGNRATLEDGTLAGSNTNLMDCMKVAGAADECAAGNRCVVRGCEPGKMCGDL